MKPREGLTITWNDKNGLVSGTFREVDGTWMVFLPNGCSFRARDLWGSESFKKAYKDYESKNQETD